MLPLVGMDFEFAIKKTLAFFAVWQQPLTPMEVWRFLWAPQHVACLPAGKAGNMKHVALIEVKKKLEEMAAGGKLGVVHQFYYLPRTPEGQLVDGKSWYLERQWLGIVALKKWRRARLGGRLLSFIPFVRMVAVGNTLAIEHAREESDIDLLIVAKAGRLWMVRLFSVVVLEMFGLRRRGKRIKDRLCLSFYVTDDALDLSAIAKSPLDPYLAYWVATLWPVFGMEIYQKFWQANAWIKNYLPLAFARRPNSPRRVGSWWLADSVRNTREWLLRGKLGDKLEQWCRGVMLRRIEGHKDSKLWQKDTDVIANDQMLKFHEVDRRLKIREEWEKWYACNM